MSHVLGNPVRRGAVLYELKRREAEEAEGAEPEQKTVMTGAPSRTCIPLAAFPLRALCLLCLSAFRPKGTLRHIHGFPYSETTFPGLSHA